MKRPTGHEAVREEDERVIDGQEYLRLLKRKRADQIVIEKCRRKFVWDDWTWELDTFRSPAGIVLLELELPSLDITVTPPPWLTVIEEVTGDPKWTNTWLAMIDEGPDAG